MITSNSDPSILDWPTHQQREDKVKQEENLKNKSLE